MGNLALGPFKISKIDTFSCYRGRMNLSMNRKKHNAVEIFYFIQTDKNRREN